MFADKYVEYDIVLTALDLILHRVSVYRHLMYNHARDTSDFIVRIDKCIPNWHLST